MRLGAPESPPAEGHGATAHTRTPPNSPLRGGLNSRCFCVCERSRALELDVNDAEI